MSDLFEIRQGYTSLDGTHYDNIKNIAFEKREDVSKIGNLVFYSKLPLRSTIYQTFDNPKVAYKIYNKHSECYKEDDCLISKLSLLQKDIKLTDFPTGIITESGNIIGQEIVYYEGSKDIGSIGRKVPFENLPFPPTELYLAMLNILKEMYDNKIFYMDVFEGNFMLLNPKEKTPIVKAIDFEPSQIYFDYLGPLTREMFFDNLYDSINRVNNNFGLVNKCLNFYNEYSSFEETEKKIRTGVTET